MSDDIDRVLAEHQHAEEQELRAIRHSLLVLIGMLFVVAAILSFDFYLGIADQTDREQEHVDLLQAICSLQSVDLADCPHLGP